LGWFFLFLFLFPFQGFCFDYETRDLGEIYFCRDHRWRLDLLLEGFEKSLLGLYVVKGSCSYSFLLIYSFLVD